LYMLPHFHSEAQHRADLAAERVAEMAPVSRNRSVSGLFGCGEASRVDHRGGPDVHLHRRLLHVKRAAGPVSVRRLACRTYERSGQTASPGRLFQRMGITVSDAIRMMLVQALAERALPFEVKVPNPETVAALHDSRNGAVTRFTSVDDLFADTDD